MSQKWSVLRNVEKCQYEQARLRTSGKMASKFEVKYVRLRTSGKMASKFEVKYVAFLTTKARKAKGGFVGHVDM